MLHEPLLALFFSSSSVSSRTLKTFTDVQLAHYVPPAPKHRQKQATFPWLFSWCVAREPPVATEVGEVTFWDTGRYSDAKMGLLHFRVFAWPRPLGDVWRWGNEGPRCPLVLL